MCLAVTSGKGGTGKSTFSTGLSFAFSQLGKKTVLVDMDEGLRCLDIMLGIESEMIFDLSDILNGTDIFDALYDVPEYENLKFIPAPNRLGLINKDSFGGFINKIKDMFDVVILDFPAGIEFSLYSVLGDDIRFITVCNPDPISVRDAAAVCYNLPDSSYEPRLIINKFDFEFMKRGMYGNIDDIIDNSAIRLLGIVPEEYELFLLPVYHKIKRKGKAMKAFTRIALRLCGQNIKLPDVKKI